MFFSFVNKIIKGLERGFGSLGFFLRFVFVVLGILIVIDFFEFYIFVIEYLLGFRYGVICSNGVDIKMDKI